VRSIIRSHVGTRGSRGRLVAATRPGRAGAAGRGLDRAVPLADVGGHRWALRSPERRSLPRVPVREGDGGRPSVRLLRGRRGHQRRHEPPAHRGARGGAQGRPARRVARRVRDPHGRAAARGVNGDGPPRGRAARWRADGLAGGRPRGPGRARRLGLPVRIRRGVVHGARAVAAAGAVERMAGAARGRRGARRCADRADPTRGIADRRRPRRRVAGGARPAARPCRACARMGAAAGGRRRPRAQPPGDRRVDRDLHRRQVAGGHLRRSGSAGPRRRLPRGRGARPAARPLSVAGLDRILARLGLAVLPAGRAAARPAGTRAPGRARSSTGTSSGSSPACSCCARWACTR
jgi:hypothetical protein